MQSFSVTSAAPDLALLTIEELRAAAGVTDDSMDDALDALGLQVSFSLAQTCGVASDGSHPATFLQESCEDTFWGVCLRRSLLLSRRPILSLGTVLVDGSEVSEDDFHA